MRKFWNLLYVDQLLANPESTSSASYPVFYVFHYYPLLWSRNGKKPAKCNILAGRNQRCTTMTRH